ILSGCAFPTMQTAAQLDSGDVVLSGSMDLPGAFLIPRFGGQVLYGVGGMGDVGAHVNSALFTSSAGLSLRLYPSDLIILGVQAAYVHPIESNEFARNFHATARLGTSTNPDRWFYGGIQATGHHILHPQYYYYYRGDREPEQVITAGAYAGADIYLSPAFSLQVEGMVSPIAFDVDDGYIDGAAFEALDRFFDERAGWGLFQVGLGLNYHYGKQFGADRPPRGVTPEPVRRDEPTPGTPPPSQPAPRDAPPPPPPEYIDDGVPLY
ncbi:MAG: hypothetical protein ACNA8W_23975, partial [Bradymonadaceae bacterium]